MTGAYDQMQTVERVQPNAGDQEIGIDRVEQFFGPMKRRRGRDLISPIGEEPLEALAPLAVRVDENDHGRRHDRRVPSSAARALKGTGRRPARGDDKYETETCTANGPFARSLPGRQLPQT